MRVKKHWMVLLTLCLAMILFVSACSSNDPAEESSGNGNGAETSGNDASGSNNTKSEESKETAVEHDSGMTGGLKLPLAEEPVTFTYFIQERADASVKEDWPIVQEMFKRTNVQIDFEPTPSAGFKEKKKILIATDSTPDFVGQVTDSEARQYGPEGVFLDLKPYMDKGLMPNITAWYEKYPDARTLTTATDGGIYMVPSFGYENWFSYAWMARKDLMDQYGLKPPTDTESFYQLLKGFKEKHPDSYPFTIRSLNSGYGLYKDFTRIFTGINGIIGYNPETKKYEFAANHPGFRDMLEYLNKLFAEGLLDPEFALMKTKPWEERMLTGKSFVTRDFKGRFERFTTTAQKADPNTAYNMFPLAPFAAEGIQAYEFRESPVNDENGIALSDSINDPEVAVQFLDYLYSEEGTDLVNLGLPGVTYEVVGGSKQFKDLGEDTVTALRRDFGVLYDGMRTAAFDKYRDTIGYTEREQEMETMYDPFLIPPPPAVVPNEEEVDKEKEIKSSFDKYIEEALTEFVMGRTPINDSTYAEFIKQANELGATEMEAMHNAQLQRALAN